MATAPALVTLSNGEVLAVGVYDAMVRLQERARQAGFAGQVWCASGYRTHAKQVQIFTSRFRQQSTGSGAYGDVRWWNGDAYGYPGIDRWVRFSSAGTVAVPGTSMHEKASAIDFGGIPRTGNSNFARWLKVNGPKEGFTPSGYNFNEAWHYDYAGNPWAGAGPVVPFPPKPTPIPIPEEALAMSDRFIAVKDGADKDRRGAFVNTDSGFYAPITWFTIGDAEAFAKALDKDGKPLLLSGAGYDIFVGALATVRNSK